MSNLGIRGQKTYWTEGTKFNVGYATIYIAMFIIIAYFVAKNAIGVA